MEYNMTMDLTDLVWVSAKRNDVAVDGFSGYFY
jgi:hypothetical protein